jgi:hypothetical protein
LKILPGRRIIGLTEGFDELRNADTDCAERILARQNDVAQQILALFRQVSFPSGSRKMDRTTSLAATSGAHFPRVRQIEQSSNDRSAFAHAFADHPTLKPLEKTAEQRSAETCARRTPFLNAAPSPPMRVCKSATPGAAGKQKNERAASSESAHG